MKTIDTATPEVRREVTTCTCGAEIVRGGARGPVRQRCRECAEKRRHGGEP